MDLLVGQEQRGAGGVHRVGKVYDPAVEGLIVRFLTLAAVGGGRRRRLVGCVEHEDVDQVAQLAA